MRRPIHLACAIAVVFAGLLVQGQTAAPARPTPETIQKMIDAQAYRPALQAIAQIMPPAPPTASAGSPANADRYTLLMQRGECLLQLKDGATATIAYDQAAVAAPALDQNDAARAMSLLIRKSVRLVYTPRTGDPAPLDLTKPDARKRAMAALLADELPAAVKKVNDALAATTLPPILAVAPTLRDLHALESAGTGGDIQTTSLIQPLADRIYGLIDTDLNRVNEQVLAIQRSASRVVEFSNGSYQMVNGALQPGPNETFSGLDGNDRQTLRDDINYLGQVSQSCEDLSAVARRYARDGQRWQALSRSSQDIQALATSVYNHE